MSASDPEFFYDFASPYAYLASLRVDDVLPVRPVWRPVSFGVIVQQTGKVPWSFIEDRSVDLDELARRTAARGIPPLRYPHGWPLETYSLTALRAALLADDAELLREVSAELFRTMFVEGLDLTDLETVLDAAGRAGMDRDALREGIQRQDIKDRLRACTRRALDLGVTGVPTVAVDGQLFWGDDRLEHAAAAL
ncbi:MAG: 2-hydroxychromene-2-carboxylate isomerase [Solirubrobacteraceae bacterium]|jgi:2-hydroxychromene-2-carboxylate isomerase